MSVRVRFAPSPTGSLHIGSVRTTLYNYFFARQQGGALVLRIEDTDQDRLVEGAIDSIYDGLRWMGIDWDEGPREGGVHGPYVQSERLAIYQQHARALVDSGAAYPCFCTKERLEEMRRAQQARKEVTRYDGLCRAIDAREASRRAAEERHVVRLKVPEDGEIGWDDLVYGRIDFPLHAIEDQVLLKSDGFPTYQLAVVIDDHLMEISHVFRGEDWLPSTPKHLLVYRAFGWEVPPHAHLPNVLGPDGKKLAKRHGATKVEQFRSEGYLPEALANYLSLVGWAPGTEEEVFSLSDLVQRFRIEQVHKAGGKWDRERLLYFNGLWIRRLDEEDLFRRVSELAPEDWDRAVLRATIPHIRERMRTLVEARDQVGFLFTDDIPRTPDAIVPKKREPAEVAALLGRVAVLVRYADPFDAPTIDAGLRALADELGWPIRDVHFAVRGAATGSRVGFSLYESIVMLGRERALDRLEKAADAIA